EGAVQALVKEKVRTWLESAPRRERPRRTAVLLGLVAVVNVGAGPSAAGFGIVAERRLEFLEQIGCRPEVAVVVVPPGRGLLHLLAHFQAVPTVEGVAFDVDRVDFLAAEDLVERLLDRRRAGSRGAGDRDDGVLDRHLGWIRASELIGGGDRVSRKEER